METTDTIEGVGPSSDERHPYVLMWRGMLVGAAQHSELSNPLTAAEATTWASARSKELNLPVELHGPIVPGQPTGWRLIRHD